MYCISIPLGQCLKNFYLYCFFFRLMWLKAFSSADGIELRKIWNTFSLNIVRFSFSKLNKQTNLFRRIIRNWKYFFESKMRRNIKNRLPQSSSFVVFLAVSQSISNLSVLSKIFSRVTLFSWKLRKSQTNKQDLC